MTELNDKVLKAIQESLPGATAGELKKFIEEANANKQALVAEKETASRFKEQLDGLVKERSKYEATERLATEAESKLKEAQKLSDNLKFDIQKEQIHQRDFVINKFEGFLSNLMKNPRAIELINEHTNYSNAQHYDGNHTQQYKIGEFRSGTVEKTETKD